MHEQAIAAFFGFNEMPLVSISDGQRAPILMPMWSPPSTMGCRLTCTRRHSIRGRPSSGAFHRKRAILVETTRFWASRTQVEHDGHAHIRQVIGPDEYHETVDDNAYTNTMAVFNLERAADAADVLKREHWGDRQPLSARLDLKEREPQSWRALAAALVTGFNVATEMAFKSPTSGTRHQHRPHQSAHNRDGISSWSRSVQTCVEALSRNQGRDEVIGPRLVDS
jgi:hypothetical protein